MRKNRKANRNIIEKTTVLSEQASNAITDEHQAQLKPWADKWIKNAMSTKAMDYKERDDMNIWLAAFLS